MYQRCVRLGTDYLVEGFPLVGRKATNRSPKMLHVNYERYFVQRFDDGFVTGEGGSRAFCDHTATPQRSFAGSGSSFTCKREMVQSSS